MSLSFCWSDRLDCSEFRSRFLSIRTGAGTQEDIIAQESILLLAWGRTVNVKLEHKGKFDQIIKSKKIEFQIIQVDQYVLTRIIWLSRALISSPAILSPIPVNKWSFSDSDSENTQVLKHVRTCGWLAIVLTNLRLGKSNLNLQFVNEEHSCANSRKAKEIQ